MRIFTGDLVALAGKGKSVRIADDALLDVAQDRSQFQLLRQGTMLVGEACQYLMPLGQLFGGHF